MKITHFVNYCSFANQSSFDLLWMHFNNTTVTKGVTNINLLDKFDNTHSKFQGFVNQMHLVIRLHPHWYPIGPIQIGFIGILFLGITLVWFTLLMEHQSPLLNDFEAFFEKFNATFGDFDKEHMFSMKIQFLCQGSCLVAVYALKFRYLACDISWGEPTFISQF